MVARGEVWWYEHPDAGRRPYLILTRTPAVAVLNQLLAVPAIRKSLCTDRITTLGPGKLHAVCEALRIAAACS